MDQLVPSRESSEIPLRPSLEEGKAHLSPSSSSDSNEGNIWGEFSRVGSVTLLVDTFGVPKQASDQIQGNPSYPFPSRSGRSFQDTYLSIPMVESLGHNFLEREGCIPPGGSIRGSDTLAEGPVNHQD